MEKTKLFIPQAQKDSWHRKHGENPPYSCNINCKFFNSGDCEHPYAPKKWFGKSFCIMTDPKSNPQLPRKCNLQIPVNEITQSSPEINEIPQEQQLSDTPRQPELNFYAVNDFVHKVDVRFEELQALCLVLAAKLEREKK